MNNKKKAFTLIELLVVMVIIGILATISTATFTSSAEKARDVKRQATVRDIAAVIRASGVGRDNAQFSIYQGPSLRYSYNALNLKNLLQDNGFKGADTDSNICYFYGYVDRPRNHNNFASKDGDFIVATWGESTSTANPGSPGPIYDGTQLAKENFAHSEVVVYNPSFPELFRKLRENDFHCDYYDQRNALPVTAIPDPAYMPYMIFSGFGIVSAGMRPAGFNYLGNGFVAWAVGINGSQMCNLYANSSCY